jgi:hypothetical protein
VGTLAYVEMLVLSTMTGRLRVLGEGS